MRILLIEADGALAACIRGALERAFFTVDLAGDAEAGLRLAYEGLHGLVLVGSALPGRDGFSVCGTLRSHRYRVPILMLTGPGGIEERVRALERGADGYLSRPFDTWELVARVRALLRRDRIHKGKTLRIADLEIETGLQRVSRAGGRSH